MARQRSSARPPRVDLRLRGRVLFAVPMATAAILLIAIGGVPFAAAVAAVAVLAVLELCRLLRVPSPVAATTAACALGFVATGYLAGQEGLAPALAASFALLFAAAGSSVAPPERARALAFGLLGVAWVGAGLAHGVMLRELDHGGALVTMVLLATFIGDSAAHIIGSKIGRRRLAPSISPRKTVEGLIAGIAVGTGVVVIFANGWHGDWLRPYEAMLLGLAVSLAAPAGDLCESMVKRSVGAKDSGELLGPHGGALDRIDAVLFAAVIGYYVASALV